MDEPNMHAYGDHYQETREDILRDLSELEPADPTLNDTICVDISDLQIILDRHLEVRAAVEAAQPEAGEALGWKLVPIEPTDLMEAYAENAYEDAGSTFPDWKAAYRAMLASAPTIQPTQPVQEAVPAKWRELLTEIADSCAGYEVRVGKKVNGDWLARARELLSATPPAQAGDAGEPSDGERLDAARYRWLRATTNFVTSEGRRIDVSNQPELWDQSIDAAIRATKEGKGSN